MPKKDYNNSSSLFASSFWNVVCFSALNISIKSNAGCNEIELNILAKLYNVSRGEQRKKNKGEIKTKKWK